MDSCDGTFCERDHEELFVVSCADQQGQLSSLQPPPSTHARFFFGCTGGGQSTKSSRFPGLQNCPVRRSSVASSREPRDERTHEVPHAVHKVILERLALLPLDTIPAAK